MYNNESIYGIAAIIAFCYIYRKCFMVNKTTDFDDYRIVQAYVQLRRKGHIK